MGVIRTKEGTFAWVTSRAWGIMLRKVDDPTWVARPEQRFALVEGFPRVPAPLWRRVITLFYRYADASDEVSVIFARHLEHPDRWRAFVPAQKVGGASVRADFSRLADLETGAITEGLPEGWVHAGSSHSHHSMSPQFSGTDDRYELRVPGLHVVVGNIRPKKYGLTASICLGGERHILPYSAVLESEPGPERHHPACEALVEREVVVTVSSVDDDDSGWIGRILRRDDGPRKTWGKWHPPVDDADRLARARTVFRRDIAYALRAGLTHDEMFAMLWEQETGQGAPETGD